MLAYTLTLGEHLVFCCDHDTRLEILRKTADTEGFPYFFEQALHSLIDYCYSPKKYEKLEQFFIEINKKELLPNIRSHKAEYEKRLEKYKK